MSVFEPNFRVSSGVILRLTCCNSCGNIHARIWENIAAREHVVSVWAGLVGLKSLMLIRLNSKRIVLIERGK